MSADPDDFLFEFLTLPREQALAKLLTVQQAMVDSADRGNKSHKAVVYAFLDHAWHEERDWTADVKHVVQTALRLQRRRNLKHDKITEPWHIDVLYGAFFGSGDPEYLGPVLLLLASDRRPDLREAAEWSFHSLLERFEVVQAAVETLASGAES